MRLFCLLFLCAAALTGCRTLPVTEIPIAKGATFDLQSPAALGQSISLEQIVDAKYGDKEFSFHCLLEVEPKLLTLVGMTPMNTRAFTLTFDGETLAVDVMPGAQLPAPPQHILADLQLALWPDPPVRGLTLDSLVNDCTFAGFPAPADGRLFKRDGEIVVQVMYEAVQSAPHWSGRILFINCERNYSLDVRTIRAEKLEP